MGISPVLLLLASIGFGIVHPGPLWSNGLGLMVAACVLAVWNFYLSFIRRRLYHLRHGSMEGCRNVSGLALIGALLVVMGAVVGFGDIGSALLGLASLSLDTAGPIWFLIWTWHDQGFWDS